MTTVQMTSADAEVLAEFIRGGEFKGLPMRALVAALEAAAGTDSSFGTSVTINVQPGRYSG